MEGFEQLLGVNPWTALFILLNTLTIFFVARKYLFGPVMQIIEQRQKEIDDMYRSAEDSQQQAKLLENAYQQKLSAANETGERIVKEAVARGQAREEEILRQASREASAMIDKAAADIAMERKKALNDAKDEISGIAMSIAQKVVGRELSGADHARLVDSFIDELGEPS